MLPVNTVTYASDMMLGVVRASDMWLLLAEPSGKG